MPEGEEELTWEQSRKYYVSRLQAALDEVTALRTFKLESIVSPPQAREKLQKLRGNLDRVEQLVTEVTALKMGAVALQKEKEETAQDAWDKLADSHGKSPVRRDFEGTEERYARWRVATFDLLREARQSRNLTEFAAQTDMRVRNMQRGLREVREELLAFIKELQWESVMER